MGQVCLVQQPCDGRIQFQECNFVREAMPEAAQAESVLRYNAKIAAMLPIPDTPANPRRRGICIAVVRHGERLDMKDPRGWLRSEDGRKYPFDCPLTHTGRRDAARLGRQFASLAFSMVVCSPAQRCIATAVEICRELCVPLCIDYSLGEIFNSDFFGRGAQAPPLRSAEELEAMIPRSVRRVGLPGRRKSTPAQLSPTNSWTGSLSDMIGVATTDSGGVDGTQEESQRSYGPIGRIPPWNESLYEARLRFAGRVEQYASLGCSKNMSFVIVSHGHCVQTCATLAQAGSDGRNCKTFVKKVECCGYLTLERSGPSSKSGVVDSASAGVDSVASLDDGSWRMSYAGVHVANTDMMTPSVTKDPQFLDCEGVTDAMTKYRRRSARHAQEEEGREAAERDQSELAMVVSQLRGAAFSLSDQETATPCNTFTSQVSPFSQGSPRDHDDELGNWSSANALPLMVDSMPLKGSWSPEPLEGRI